MATEIAQIARSLKEKVPSTSQEATQRIAALLSNKRRGDDIQDGDAYFGLGRKFMEKPERRLKTPNRGRERKKLAKVKGCWVCGENHMARSHHSKKDIDEAVSRLKSTGAYVLIEDAAQVFCSHASDGSDNSSGSDSDTEDISNIAMHVEEICDINSTLESTMANKAFILSYNPSDVHQGATVATKSTLQNQEVPFHGIVIDPGANFVSTISMSQYQAYCMTYNVPARIEKSNPRKVRGIGGIQEFFGTVIISVPFPNFDRLVDFSFSVTSANVPTLLCLKALKSTVFGLDVRNDLLFFEGKNHKLTLRNGILWHTWSEDITLYTTDDLLRLHRSFGHPSASALLKLLKRADQGQANKATWHGIKDLAEKCMICARNSRKPKRFKLTVGNEDARFNHCVAVDIMFINSKAVLHVVDEATHYSAARWLKNHTSQEVWRALLNCWIYVYAGPPDFLRVDQGSNFVSREFKSSVDTSGITLLEAPVECPNTMSHAERYHGPLRVAYNKIAMDIRNASKEDLLQMAVAAVNNTVGPEGLCPTLCVFGVLPRPARTTFAPNQISRAKAIDSAAEQVQKFQTKQKVKLGRKHRGPYPGERHDLECLKYGDEVLVFRQKSKTWEGPFKFVSLEGETVCISLPHGRKIFRSNAVKPYPSSEIVSNHADSQFGNIDFSEARKKIKSKV